MTNIVTEASYQGKNVEALTEAKYTKGYSSDVWGTFLQWREKGRSIKKGEKGVRLYKYIDDESIGPDGKLHKSIYGKSFVVFNLEQTEESKGQS